MNAYNLAGLVHLVALCGLTAVTVRRLFSGLAARACAGFLLVWGNLAYTALLLSLFSQLGNRWLYFSSSLLLAFLSWLWISRRISGPLALTAEREPFYGSRMERLLGWFLIATLLIAAACTLTICTRYYADNWDTLAYRFARVFFYLGRGNLLQFSTNSDYRALTYPFNSALLYVFPALYQFDGRCFNLVTFVCWGMSALGVYLLARVLGASKLGSLVAAWLCAMAPIVLCEAASTNDDVMAAVPMLLGTSFACDAFGRRNGRSIVLAALGFGLGFGTKLHWVFFLPVGVVAAATLVAYRLARKTIPREARKGLLTSPILLLAVGVAAPLGAGFIACNYLSTGEIFKSRLQDALNRPFRLDVARQQIVLTSSQLLLSVIPDVPIHFDPSARRRTYDEFDRWTNQRWFQNVNQGSAFTAYSYRFQGIADPNGYWYFEQTLWLGFLPLLMALLLIIGLVSRVFPVKMSLLFLAFFAWHISFAAMSKYMETICAYYSYPAVLTCAGLGLAWDALHRRKTFVHRLMLCGMGAVVLTHLLVDFNLLNFNAQRNLHTALQRNFDGETSVTRIEEPAIRAIRNASYVNIPYLHWELLYWDLMRRNPGAIYTTGADMIAQDTRSLNLLSVSNDGQYLIGRSPESGPAGLTYLGTSSSGYLFGTGASVGIESPSRNHYFLVRGGVSRKPSDQSISGFRLDTNAVVGLEDHSSIEFRLISNSSDTKHWTSSWLTAHSGVQILETPSQGRWTEVILESRSKLSKRSRCDVNQTTYPFSVSSFDDMITEATSLRPSNRR